MQAPPITGLILSGGGARAAYQVGVLAAIQQLALEYGGGQRRLYDVIAGTSAGAINAAAMAGGADDLDRTTAHLLEVWQNLHVDQVYRADSLGVIRTGAGWLSMVSLGWMLARWRRLKPRSLLDNEPLGGLLERVTRLERVPQMLAEGHLRALAVSASSYSSGVHMTFYDAAHEPSHWERSQRRAVRQRITVQHLLASSAIPFVFPARQLPIEGQPEWFGDGSMRQAAPISPAIHLGAQRVLVVGAGRMHEPPGERHVDPGYPSLAQIGGHALSSIFLDTLAVDIERLQRVNRTLSLMGAEQRAHTTLRPVDLLVIAPSQRLDDLAARHLQALPPMVRALLRGVGVNAQSGGATSGSALTSYLLFEADYTRELIALGEADTLARRDEVLRFFGWKRPQPDGRADGEVGLPADQSVQA